MTIALDKLLDAYRVLSVVSIGENLQNDLNALKTEMNYIRLNNQQVSSDISNLAGQLEVIKKLIEPELKETCKTDMGQEIKDLCDRLQVNLMTWTF